METNDDAVVMVWSTYPDAAAAERAARSLVEARLAACVVVLPTIASIYRWNGRVERSEEVGFLVKTTRAREEETRAAIERDHPYEVAAVLTLTVEAASAAYGAWVAAETSPLAP